VTTRRTPATGATAPTTVASPTDAATNAAAPPTTVASPTDAAAPPATVAAAPPATVRGRRRREAVLDAAEELFLARGFLGVSMDELGAAAGITGPGLYRHVASKDALLMAVLDRIWADLKPAIATADILPPDAALDVLLAAHLDLAVGQPGALVLLIQELRHLPGDYRAQADRNHRRYVDAWVTALLGRAPGTLTRDQARTVALAVHGLIDNAVLRGGPDRVATEGHRLLLERLARGALQSVRTG
jgi:AcrR family transcriptional regulator